MVVAADTALTHVSTGVYSYTFDDPAYDLTYEYWVKWVYSGSSQSIQRYAYGPTSPVAASTSYSLAQIRLDGRAQSRNAMDSTAFFTRDIDKAFQRAANRWLRGTKQVRTLSQLQLTVGSATLPAFPTGFLPEFVIDSYLTLSGAIVYPKISITDIQTVYIAQRNNWMNTSSTDPPTVPPTGQPSLIGFSSTTAGVLDYLPDKAYLVNIFWWKMLEAFTPGCMGAWSSSTAYQPGDVVSSGGTLYQAISSNTNVAVGTAATWTNLGAGTVENPITQTFALPDESIDIVTQWGIPAFLQMSAPEKAPQANMFLVEFDKEIKRIAARDAGGRGERVMFKRSPTDCYGNWTRGTDGY